MYSYGLQHNDFSHNTSPHENETKEKEVTYNSDTRVLSGLHNFGSSCYRNAIIQALCGTDLLAAYLISHRFNDAIKSNILTKLCSEKEKEFNKNKDGNDSDKFEFDIDLVELTKLKKKTITYVFYQLINYMWSENCEVTPKTFSAMAKKRIKMTRGDDQEDASEFLIFLFEELEKDLKIGCSVTDIKIITPEVEEFSKIYSQMNQDATEEEESSNKISLMEDVLRFKRENFNKFAVCEYVKFWKEYLSRKGGNYSVLIDIFTFTTMTKVECLSCKNINAKFEPDTMMKISVPQFDRSDSRYDKPVELFDLIQSECSTIEELEGDNKYHCDICASKQDATKRIEFWDYPERLIIHLKLFDHKIVEMGGMWREITTKINTRVNFPMDLDLNPLKSDYNSLDIDYKYELYAIVKHSGNHRGGHYVSYVKNPLNKQWFLFDDTNVRPATDARVKEESPYMLFYKRINKIDIELDSDSESTSESELDGEKISLGKDNHNEMAEEA